MFKIILKKCTSLILLLTVILVSIAPYFNTPFNPASAYASETNSCLTSTSPDTTSQGTKIQTARVGGVALDQAATFLAAMSDITGAYYDTTKDRIVFVGKTNTTAPKFDKDDLAVAIRSLIFNNTIPSVSMEFKDPNNPTLDPNLKVLYFGGIEDTQFGKVLVDADYRLKIYSHGYDENKQKITSSVPGYKSFLDRWAEKGEAINSRNHSRFWISPKTVLVKKDDGTNSFVFDQVAMQVETEGLNPGNDPSWNQAAQEFVQHQTEFYDLYANESPAYFQSKQLAKMVAIVKWISDNRIPNDFQWAQKYQPKFVATPREVPQLTTPHREVNGNFYAITGGVSYDTANTYSPDTGTATSIKNSSEAAGSPKEDVHWTFVNNGQEYEAVAVAAQAFRSLGAYTSSETDMSFPAAGDLTLAFQRAYSSFSGEQQGIGRGWEMPPARLIDNKPGWTSLCATPPTGFTGGYPSNLAFQTLNGSYESFSFACNYVYKADKPEYHSQLFRNIDGSYTVRLKNQVEYVFAINLKLTQIKDKNGNTIGYNYDPQGRLSIIQDAQNHTLTVSYNTQGLIAAVSDWSGRAVRYEYDTNGNLISVTDPKGGIAKYTYDDKNKLMAITDRLGQTIIQNTYTDEAKVATQTDVGLKTISFVYNDASRAISIVDNNGRTSKIEYDEKARILKSTDPFLKSVIYTYATELSPLTVTNKNFNKTTHTYDINGNTTSVTFPDGKKITYVYNIKNRLIQVLDGRYGFTPKETKYTFDATGNLTQVSEATVLTNYTYDQYGEMLSFINHVNQKTAFTRDNFGNVLTVTDPLTKTTTYTYDTLSRLTQKKDPDLKTFSFTYDANNNILAKMDAFGATSFAYDAENRLQTVTAPNTAHTTYRYNASGSLSTVNDETGGETTYAYDIYQNLTQQQDALLRITTNQYDQLNRQTQATTPLGKISKWGYDANGNISKRIDAKNNVTLYTYDVLDRLTKITYPDLKTVTFTYDNRGNLTKMVDLTGTTIYMYDLFDRLIKVTNPYSRSISYAYDAIDNLIKITYPDSKAVNYVYNANNRLQAVTDWNNQKTTYAYTPNGLLANESRPNGVTSTYTYDGANRLVAISHTKAPSQLLARFTYEHDVLGNITKVTEGTGTLAQSTFSYDLLGRVIGATYPDGSVYAYTYDAVGNRIAQTLNTTTTNFTYNNDNQLTQAGSLGLSYDNNGNLTNKTGAPSQSFSYNFDDRLTNFINSTGTTTSTTRYTYDGLGKRLQKVRGSSTTRYVNDIQGPLEHVLAETNSFNTINTWYTYGTGLLSQGASASTSRLYPLHDGLGNTRLLTNASGTTVRTYQYDSFGTIKSTTGTATNNYLFSGEQSDPESSLYYLRARYYDPTVGRFISRDPVKGTLTNPQSQNPYAYALNNPVNLSDPSGEFVETAWDIANIAYDIYTCDWTALGVDTAATLIPFVPAGITKVGKVTKAAKEEKIAGRITGYTEHGLIQAISRDGGRGVDPGAMLDAVKNPKQVVEQADGAIKYIGEKATVVLNKAGEIITTWGQPRNP